MGFNISKKLGGDPKKVEEGVWIDETSGLRLKIARWNNKKYRKFLRDVVTTPKFKLDRAKQFNVDSMHERVKQAVARYILLDWEGMEEDGPDGSPVTVKYSPEKALECFDEYPEFYDMVVEYSQDISFFKADKKDDAAKN